jgi:hypothetical protein
VIQGPASALRCEVLDCCSRGGARGAAGRQRGGVGAWLSTRRAAGGVGRARAGEGVRTGKNRRGREAADRWGPVTVMAIQIKSNRSKTIQTNLNSNQTRSNFILSKLDLHKLEKIEIKYCFEVFD